jgi:hypothetical protein
MIFRSCEHALRLPRKRQALQLENVIESAECPCLGQELPLALVEK